MVTGPGPGAFHSSENREFFRLKRSASNLKVKMKRARNDIHVQVIIKGYFVLNFYKARVVKIYVGVCNICRNKIYKNSPKSWRRKKGLIRWRVLRLYVEWFAIHCDKLKGHIIISGETRQNIKQRALAKKPIEKIKWSTKNDLINQKKDKK